MSAPVQPGSSAGPGTSTPLSVVDEVRDFLAGRPEVTGRARVDDLDGFAEQDPPAVVVGPPSWEYRTPGADPVNYTLSVAVVVPHGERAVRDLLEIVPLVAAALDEPPGIAVMRVRPDSFPAGAVDLPAYQIDIEVAS